MHIPPQKKSDAIATLELILEAAKNSNDSGERALMAAAKGLQLLGALKRLMPELRRMRADRIISEQQFSDAEGSIAAAEGREAASSGTSPQPTITSGTPPESGTVSWLNQMPFMAYRP